VGAYENETVGAKRCLQIKKTFNPNQALAERYAYQFALFKEVHDLLQEPFNKLARMP
jgi:hypothetical protein